MTDKSGRTARTLPVLQTQYWPKVKLIPITNSAGDIVGHGRLDQDGTVFMQIEDEQIKSEISAGKKRDISICVPYKCEGNFDIDQQDITFHLMDVDR